MSDQTPHFLIAVVGQATLVKRSQGKYELLDCGSEADRKEILQWAAIHLEGAHVAIAPHHAPTRRDPRST